MYQAARHALASATERVAHTEPGLAVSTEVLAGSPAQALLKAAADASLLVVGSRGAGGLAAMVLGSVSRYLATRSLTAQERAVMSGSDIRAYAATRVESVLGTWQDNYPAVQAGWEIVHAHPARVLIGASARADLVVLGRPAAGSAVGSITHPVLSHAHGPVAIVPGD